MASPVFKHSSQSNKPVSQPASQPTRQSVSQSTSQPANQPASQLVNQSSSNQTACKPDSQPANQTLSQSTNHQATSQSARAGPHRPQSVCLVEGAAGPSQCAWSRVQQGPVSVPGWGCSRQDILSERGGGNILAALAQEMIWRGGHSSATHILFHMYKIDHTHTHTLPH